MHVFAFVINDGIAHGDDVWLVLVAGIVLVRCGSLSELIERLGYFFVSEGYDIWFLGGRSGLC